MPKKAIYSREIILNYAYKILVERGLQDISARNLAREMNSSTIPIYTFFSSMDEVKDELLKLAKNKFMEYIREDYTDLVLLNVGMGVVLFAREEKELFRSIFLRATPYRDLIEEILEDFKTLIKEQFAMDPRFQNLSSERADWLLNKGWIYAQGLATLTCTGYIDNPTDEYIKKNLLETGRFFIEEAINPDERDYENC